jgi:uncharacterized membrane protein YjgN (DUF898 family)
MQPYVPVMNAVPVESAVTPARREIPFRFTGTPAEYFRIWIVNTLLTIVTLGIYSAWAKVRNQQYFYRHTSLDGSSFEYLANPIAILKGRLIAAAALGVFFASQHYSLTLYIVLAVLFVLVTPWVWVKALAFNARNSAFRNIRFAFAGRVGEAFGLYLGMLAVTLVSCGFAYPYAEWRLTQFVAGRHLYGDRPFQWHTKVVDYFVAYLIAFALTFPAYLAVVGGVVAMAVIGGKSGSEPKDGMEAGLVVGILLFYAYLVIPGAILRARLANLFYGGIQVGDHYLVSKQRGLDLLKLYATNLVAIAFSFGLLIPWARIRLAVYRASTLSLIATGNLYAEKLLDDEPGALGQGLTDLGDFDIGIGT